MVLLQVVFYKEEMLELLRIKDRTLFRLLLQTGLIVTICQLFIIDYGVFVIPVSIIVATVFIPTFTFGNFKRLKFVDEKIANKGSKSNFILLFCIPIIYICAIATYWIIIEKLEYDINNLVWVFFSSLVYFRIIFHFLINRLG